MDRICPKCGILSSKRKFIGDFCADCFSSQIEIKVPREVSVVCCGSCGRIRWKGWVLMNEKNLEGYVLSKCRGRYVNASVKTTPNPRATFTVFKDNTFTEFVLEFRLKFENSVCPDCSRKTSGYYEAIIQIRGKNEKISKLFRKISRKLEKETSISKVEELKEGIDFYVVSKKAAAEALSSLGFHFTTSNKLFGVKDGRRVYRTTFCVRL